MAKCETQLCGDLGPTHTTDEHKSRSFIPALAIGAVIILGIKHASETGKCLCGSMMERFKRKK